MLHLVSWNVNGTNNISHVPLAYQFLLGFTLIHLQETFEVNDSRAFVPSGYIRFSSAATQTLGRPSGGLTSLFRSDFFGNGSLQQIATPAPWILAIEWTTADFVPIIFVNTYLPRHSSGFSSADIALARSFFEDLRGQNPATSFCFSGQSPQNRHDIILYFCLVCH